MKRSTIALFALNFGLAIAALAPPTAVADGDWPYQIGSTSQVFDNNYNTYKTNEGVSTNIFSDLLPINPLGDEGRVKAESRYVPSQGTSATRFDDAQTGLQIDFKF